MKKFKIQNNTQELSREEQRNIMGGLVAACGCSSTFGHGPPAPIDGQPCFFRGSAGELCLGTISGGGSQCCA